MKILRNHRFMSDRTEVKKILNELEIELKEDIASLIQELKIVKSDLRE